MNFVSSCQMIDLMKSPDPLTLVGRIRKAGGDVEDLHMMTARGSLVEGQSTYQERTYPLGHGKRQVLPGLDERPEIGIGAYSWNLPAANWKILVSQRCGLESPMALKGVGA